MYLEYLDWLKMFPSESYKYIYEGASPDTLVWRNRLGYNETMTNNLRHLLTQVTVVGVNWIQAVEFKWRTDRVNEAILEWIFEKGAKTNDVSESSFSTETYLKAQT
jgi:gliding motility-associated lipoprotein GldJ